MKSKFLVIACGMLVLTSACNNSSESNAKETDTAKAEVKDTAVAVAPAPAEVTPVIDSAAITKAFLDAQNKSKKGTAPKAKKQGKNEVVVYSETPIPTHEALEQPKNAPATERVIHTKEYVYFLPSQKAEYPGGQPALAAHIKKSMKYPDEALDRHIEGTVYAEVTLDTLGYVKNVEFPGTHLGFGLEEETAHVLKSTPRWIPAKDNGKRVNSKITVPVVYKITQ